MIHRDGLLATIALALMFTTSTPARTLSPQTAARGGGLTIAGEVATPVTLSAADLKAMPRTRVEQIDHGQQRVHEGVLVSTILERAGVPVGTGLKGAALRTVVIAHATDGAPLAEPQGPLRLVVPKDTRGARSVRMLIRLEVVRLGKDR